MRQYLHLLLTILTLTNIEHYCHSQDSTAFAIKPEITWSLPHSSFSKTSFSYEYAIAHSPSEEDSLFCEKYVNLVTAQPTKKNHIDFYSLACALWNLNRLVEAEKMFLKIVSSKESYFEDSYYHSSDIPGDKTTNAYGYGSYTSNYKNYACRYLTKIYVEEKKFDLALQYLEYADKKYIVLQNCGTGHMFYRSEIDGLYGLCFQGLEKYDSIIDLFLPQYPNYSGGMLIKALKKQYSQAEIEEQLKIAEESIVCIVDTFLSSTFIIQGYGEENETSIELKYTSGRATMILFDREISLPTPYLENGDTVTRERFVKEFRESEFYISLIS